MQPRLPRARYRTEYHRFAAFAGALNPTRLRIEAWGAGSRGLPGSITPPPWSAFGRCRFGRPCNVDLIRAYGVGSVDWFGIFVFFLEGLTYKDLTKKNAATASAAKLMTSILYGLYQGIPPLKSIRTNET